MALPDHVTTQYGVYTLACRSLLTHLPQLRDVSSSNFESYVQRFDKALENFFGTTQPFLTGVQTASARFIDRLANEREDVYAENQAVGAVFDQVIDSVDEYNSSWNFEEDVESLHLFGRHMAKCFYHKSPWENTRNSLDKKASLEFSGNPGPLMSYRPNENKIIVRFSTERRFDDYLLYPFSFLHEYTAHIFGVDLMNTIFNDGWMMFAAHRFFQNCRWQPVACLWNANGKSCGFRESHLDRGHVEACSNCFPSKLRQREQGQRQAFYGYKVAEDLYSVSSPLLSSCFWDLTWELAAFSPEPGEENKLITVFIKRLDAELSNSPSTLRRKLDGSCDFRSLLRIM